MSAYDVIIKKGEKLGFEKGHQLGIDKAKVDVAINAYKKNIHPTIFAEITNLSSNKINEILKNSHLQINL